MMKVDKSVISDFKLLNNILPVTSLHQEQCFSNLRLRKLNLQDYIQKMINRSTNGFDITMIILGMMLDISIMVLYQKYMWVSHQRDLHTFDIYLVLNKGEHFHSACPKRQGIRSVLRFRKNADLCTLIHLQLTRNHPVNQSSRVRI